MARIRCVVAVGCPHHITQRGNFRRVIFFDDLDRQTYIDLLTASASEARLRIWGHCLSNHVHLIVVPERPDAMARTFRIAHSNYSHWLI